MCIYYLQVIFPQSPIVPRFGEFLPVERFHPHSDIRTLKLTDAVDLATLWRSTNSVNDVGDLFLGFLRFYAMDFE